MKEKYIPKLKGNTDPSKGKVSDPSHWKTGPDPLTREKYYAWLKHRCQARFRNQLYDLTWEQWQCLWTDDLYAQRGRKKQDLCISRVDMRLGWCIDNVDIISRDQQLKREGAHRRGKYV